MSKTNKQPNKSRNAEQTQLTILAAARKCFSQQSYEQVGVRDIAKEAGINAALIIRYFGSKEQLFTLAVAEGFSITPFFEMNRSILGEKLARYLLEEADEDSFYPILALLRSAVSPIGSLLLRQLLEKQFIQPLSEWLSGEQKELRASLIASTLLGLAVSRDVIEIEPLEQASPEALVDFIAPVLQSFIDGTSGK